MYPFCPVLNKICYGFSLIIKPAGAGPPSTKGTVRKDRWLQGRNVGTHELVGGCRKNEEKGRGYCPRPKVIMASSMDLCPKAAVLRWGLA